MRSWLGRVLVTTAIGSGAWACAVGTDSSELSSSLATDGGPVADARHDGAAAQRPGTSSGDAAAEEASVTAPKDSGSDAPVTTPTGCAFSGALVTFDLTKLSGTTPTLAPSAAAPGLTVLPLARVGVAATSASGAMNASGWPTASSKDAGKYFTFKVTPPSGCTLTLTKLSVDLSASASGPATAGLASSVDGFSALESVPVTSGGPSDVTVKGVAAVASGVELRIFGYGASAAGGTLRVATSLSLTGSLN